MVLEQKHVECAVPLQLQVCDITTTSQPTIQAADKYRHVRSMVGAPIRGLGDRGTAIHISSGGVWRRQSHTRVHTICLAPLSAVFRLTIDYGILSTAPQRMADNNYIGEARQQNGPGTQIWEPNMGVNINNATLGCESVTPRL